MTQKKKGRQAKELFAVNGALLLVAGVSGALTAGNVGLAWAQSPSHRYVAQGSAEAPAQEQANNGKSAADSSSTESKAIGTNATESKAAESNSTESKAVGTNAAESKAADYTTTESRAVESNAADHKAANSKAADSKAQDSSTVEPGTTASALQPSVDILTVVLDQDVRETVQAISQDQLNAFVKSVKDATYSYLTRQANYDTTQLIVRCSIKPDGKQSFTLTSKPGLSGRLTAGLDEALRAVPSTQVKSLVSMEIIFQVADNQTQFGRQARRLTRAGKADEAVALLAPQAKEDCKNAFFWQQLGWAYSTQGDYPNAEKALKYAVQLDPRDFDSWNYLVSTYHSQGKVQEAEEAAKKNLDCAPNEDSADIVNINSALYGGDWPKAETILRRLCQRTREYGTAYQVILAYALRWQGKNDEAKQILESALKEQIDLKEPRQRLDDYYAKLAEKQLALLNGDWKTAEELGRQDLSKDPKDYESLYDMGLALKGEGKLDEARKAFEAAVQPVTPKSVLQAVDVQMKELPGATTNSGH